MGWDRKWGVHELSERAGSVFAEWFHSISTTKMFVHSPVEVLVSHFLGQNQIKNNDNKNTKIILGLICLESVEKHSLMNL